MWSENAFYCVNGLHVCILSVKMRIFLCGESTVATLQKKLLSTLPGSLLKLSKMIQSTPDNLNFQGKSKKGSSYRESTVSSYSA